MSNEPKPQVRAGQVWRHNGINYEVVEFTGRNWRLQVVGRTDDVYWTAQEMRDFGFVRVPNLTDNQWGVLAWLVMHTGGHANPSRATTVRRLQQLVRRGLVAERIHARGYIITDAGRAALNAKGK